MVRKAQAAAWEEKFMAMKAKQKESNKVTFSSQLFSGRCWVKKKIIFLMNTEFLRVAK